MRKHSHIKWFALVLMVLVLIGCEETADVVDVSVRKAVVSDGYVLVLTPKDNAKRPVNLWVQGKNHSLNQQRSWQVSLQDRPVELGPLEGWTWQANEIATIRTAGMPETIYTICVDPKRGAFVDYDDDDLSMFAFAIGLIIGGGALIHWVYEKISDWRLTRQIACLDEQLAHIDEEMEAPWVHKQ